MQVNEKNRKYFNLDPRRCEAGAYDYKEVVGNRLIFVAVDYDKITRYVIGYLD